MIAKIVEWKQITWNQLKNKLNQIHQKKTPFNVKWEVFPQLTRGKLESLKCEASRQENAGEDLTLRIYKTVNVNKVMKVHSSDTSESMSQKTPTRNAIH